MKKIKYLLVTFILSFVFVLNVNAASGRIAISASSTSVAVGSTTNVSITCSSTSTLNSCQYTIKYDKSKLKLMSGDSSVAWFDTTGSKSIKRKSFYLSFKSIDEGSSTISINTAELGDYNGNELKTSTGSVTIRGYIPSKENSSSSSSSNNNVTYSSNNNLKELSVSVGKLSPTFDKSKTEYSLDLDALIKSVTVKAVADDTNAKVSGNKTYKLSSGVNKIKVVVTSEKGTKKTYTITANVLDKNPIKKTINNSEYTLIKDKDLLTKLDNYDEKEISIDGVNIPALYSEITGYTLVGLKDSLGKISLFVYDNDNYTLYEEFTFSEIKLRPIDTDKKLKGYIKTSITIEDLEVTGYKKNKDSNYTIFYAMNVETGDEGWYSYEKTENTVQKFSQEKSDSIMNNDKSDMMIKLLASITIVLSILIIMVATSKGGTKKKKTKSDVKETKDAKETKDDKTSEETPVKKKKTKKKKDTKILDEW